MPIALLASFLAGCATPSSTPPPATPISPALLAPCPPHLPRALVTWGDLALDYADLAGELAECRARHRALSDAAGAK
jgi:hypothetical protein